MARMTVPTALMYAIPRFTIHALIVVRVVLEKPERWLDAKGSMSLRTE